MRREPMVVSRQWLERERRRGMVREWRCVRCGAKCLVPWHLYDYYRRHPVCEDCASPEEARGSVDAAAEWRSWHTISPLIVGLIDGWDE